MSDEVIPFRPGLELGMGVRSFSQDIAANKPVKITPIGQPIYSQTVEYSHEQISSMSDLAKKLGISAALAIDAGGVAASGQGSFLNEDKAKDADCNFLLRCVVRNIKTVETQHTFTDITKAPAEKEQFLQEYGDAYIADFVEGGEFIAVMSFKSSSSSSVTDIVAELELQLSKVSGKGSGQYQTSTIKALSTSSVSVKWSGTNKVNPKKLPWTIDLALEEAVAFPANVGQSKNYIGAILRNFDALQEVKSLLHGLPDCSDAKQDLYKLLYEQGRLQDLRAQVESMIKQETEKKGELIASTAPEAYEATRDGLEQAQIDIEASLDIIKSNNEVLRKNPNPPQKPNGEHETGAGNGALEKKEYLTDYAKAFEIKRKLPVWRAVVPSSRLTPINGTSLAAAALTQDGVHGMGLFWQHQDTSIVRVSYKEAKGWSTELETVVSEAAPNTPMAVCVSKDGNEQRIFYFDSSWRLVDAVKRIGDKKFGEGDLSSTQLSQDVSPWSKLAVVQRSNGDIQLFFQLRNDTLSFIKYDATKKEWKGPEDKAAPEIAMPTGGSLAACVVGAKDDPAKDKLSVFFQRTGANEKGILQELRFNPDGADRKWDEKLNVFSKPLPIGTGACAFAEGNKICIMALSRSNSAIISTYDAEKDNWSEPQSIGDGVRSPGLAAQPCAAAGDVSRKLYLQIPQAQEVQEMRWKGNAWVLSDVPGNKPKTEPVK